MKKLLILAAIVFSGCDSSEFTAVFTNAYSGTEIYDGCEYVYFSGGTSTWGAHKGNCSNPIHCTK